MDIKKIGFLKVYWKVYILGKFNIYCLVFKEVQKYEIFENYKEEYLNGLTQINLVTWIGLEGSEYDQKLLKLFCRMQRGQRQG